MAANDVVSAKDMFRPCNVEEEPHDETIISISISETDNEHEDWVNERRRYIKRYVPLYKSCLKGDWKEAKRIIDEDPNIIRASITQGCQKPLHVAVGAGHILFVEQLMKYLTEEDLLSKDAKGNTAFCFAVAVGSVPIAELMIRKNPHLPQIRGGEGMTTLYMATLFGHEEMAWFLYPKLIKDIEVGERLGIFFSCIHNDLYEIALKMLHDHRELAVARDMNGETAVHLLARKPSIFSIKRPGIWKCFVQYSFVGGTNNRKYLGTPGIQLLKFLWETVVWQHDWMVLDVIRRPSHALFIATKMGNFEFVAELLHSYPDLIWETDEKHRSLFHIAVMFHDTSFFNLLNQLGVYKDFIVSFKDDENNNILHLAAKLAPPNQLGAVPGPAFQMQRELLWFKGVERTLQPSYLEMKNAEDKTPRDLFSEEHKDLMVKGESWMKSVASSCSLASTLIAISVFASLTGVIDDRTTHNGGGGTHTTPAVCVLSNIFALFYSSLGIIIFVSILSSRFAEDDFLISLPLKLIVGLGALYISTIAMMVSFGTALYTTYHHRLNWLPILIFILASLLISCLYRLHFPLVSYVLRTTYYSWVRLPTTHNL
ncbi:hypothetical protein ABKV19_026960 [Rosa sericea]